MYNQVLLATALVGIASCVPSEQSHPLAAPAPIQAVSSRALLQGLELQVRDDPQPTRAPSLAQLPALRTVAEPFLEAARTADDAARATDCLTQAVYYEARSEPRDGQRAVAQVVLNRVRDRAFPHSVCGVVYQRGTRSKGCQFTFICDGSMGARREPGAWDRARTVAQAALAGSVYAPVGAAVFYHTHAVSPWWAPSLSRIGSIGAHIFYQWPGAMARSLSRGTYSGSEPLIEDAAPASAVAAVRTQFGDAGEVTVHRMNGAATRGGAASDVAGVSIHRGMTAAGSPDVQEASTGPI